MSMTNGEIWQYWEIEILSQSRYLTAKEISPALPHRSRRSIREARKKYGLIYKGRRTNRYDNPWTDDDISTLILNQDLPASEIAKIIGRTEKSVLSMRSALQMEGILRKRKYPRFTDEEKQIIDEYAPDLDMIELLIPFRERKMIYEYMIRNGYLKRARKNKTKKVK